jgi:hypothetical protein
LLDLLACGIGGVHGGGVGRNAVRRRDVPPYPVEGIAPVIVSRLGALQGPCQFGQSRQTLGIALGSFDCRARTLVRE